MFAIGVIWVVFGHSVWLENIWNDNYLLCELNQSSTVMSLCLLKIWGRVDVAAYIALPCKHQKVVMPMFSKIKFSSRLKRK